LGTESEVRKIAVEAYLSGDRSLRALATEIGVHRNTLWRWVRRYRNRNIKKPGIEQELSSQLRTSDEIEKTLVSMKEYTPSLTLEEACKAFREKGIGLSTKTVWKIWRKYALTRQPDCDPFEAFGPPAKESETALALVRYLIREGRDEEAAEIANSLPSFPRDPVIRKIPEELLTPRRQLDHLLFPSGNPSHKKEYEKARYIRVSLEKQGLFHSSIVAGIHELRCLDCLSVPDQVLELASILRKRSAGIRNPMMRFILSRCEGRAYAVLLNIVRARKAFAECKRLLHQMQPVAGHYYIIGNAMTSLTEYSQALIYYQKTLSLETNVVGRSIASLMVASMRCIEGRYEEIKNYTSDLSMQVFHIYYLSVYGFYKFVIDDLYKAQICFNMAFDKSETAHFWNFAHTASLGLAAIQSALCRKEEADIILKRYNPLLARHKMLQELLIRQILMGKDITISGEQLGFPVIRLLSYLQDRSSRNAYARALNYAKRKKLLGILHWYIVFFPEHINRYLENGKDTGLPETLLNLPVFSRKRPVYQIRFLGKVVIYKNGSYCRTKLSPKEKSFLIHLALRAGTPGYSISVKELYDNFWPDSGNPAPLLSHLLTRLRKELAIPGHFLVVSAKGRTTRMLVNRGIYFRTDFEDFNTLLKEAKFLKCNNDRKTSEETYRKAFKLVRNRPFMKMYDFWSEDTLGVFTHNLQEAVLQFSAMKCDPGQTSGYAGLPARIKKAFPYLRMT
jgi:transposase-like protein/tetratricopeptide (TPR) repeat protein